MANRSRTAVFHSLESRLLLSGEPADLPRYLTDKELAQIAAGLTAGPENVPTPPPSGLIDPVSEFDEMEGLVISWIGSTSWRNILAQITRRVTVEGAGRMYIGVTGSSTSTVSSATATLTSYGADLSKVTFFSVALNSIWARDYGPRYVYESGVRVVTDHVYSASTRTLDNNQPIAYSNFRQHNLYNMAVGNTLFRHGGGNYHLNGDGDAYATSLINSENPSLSTTQIVDTWKSYQGNTTTITNRFPSSVDGTGHIDMWMQIWADKKVFISDWPSNVGSTQDVICDTTATLMASRGYEVTRIPAYSIGGTHYTFANMVVFNDIILLPQYNNGPGATISNQAFNTVQNAVGAGKQVFQINADSIVTAAGVFHCIVQHIPKHLGAAGPNGGLAPTAYLRGPNDAPSLVAGQQINLQWITDDDAPNATVDGVRSVQLQLSTDGGQTYAPIHTSTAPNGSFLWTVPAGVETARAKLRVVATDAVGNTGSDDTNLPFSIGNPIAPALSTAGFGVNERAVSFTFDRPLDLATIDSLDLEVVHLGTGVSTRPASAYALSADRKTLSFALPVLADGNYRFDVAAGSVAGENGLATATAALVTDFVLAADANRDRVVDFADLLIIAQNFDSTGRTFSQGNIDYSADGAVNFEDVLLIAQRFGSNLQTTPARSASSRRRGGAFELV